jgi:hypothetical protein
VKGVSLRGLPTDSSTEYVTEFKKSKVMLKVLIKFIQGVYCWNLGVKTTNRYVKNGMYVFVFLESTNTKQLYKTGYRYPVLSCMC